MAFRRLLGGCITAGILLAMALQGQNPESREYVIRVVFHPWDTGTVVWDIDPRIVVPYIAGYDTFANSLYVELVGDAGTCNANIELHWFA